MRRLMDVDRNGLVSKSEFVSHFTEAFEAAIVGIWPAEAAPAITTSSSSSSSVSSAVATSSA
jgi:hypothetical protein